MWLAASPQVTGINYKIQKIFFQFGLTREIFYERQIWQELLQRWCSIVSKFDSWNSGRKARDVNQYIIHAKSLNTKVFKILYVIRYKKRTLGSGIILSHQYVINTSKHNSLWLPDRTANTTGNHPSARAEVYQPVFWLIKIISTCWEKFSPTK